MLPYLPDIIAGSFCLGALAWVLARRLRERSYLRALEIVRHDEDLRAWGRSLGLSDEEIAAVLLDPIGFYEELFGMLRASAAGKVAKAIIEGKARLEPSRRGVSLLGFLDQLAALVRRGEDE